MNNEYELSNDELIECIKIKKKIEKLNIDQLDYLKTSVDCLYFLKNMNNELKEKKLI